VRWCVRSCGRRLVFLRTASGSGHGKSCARVREMTDQNYFLCGVRNRIELNMCDRGRASFSPNCSLPRDLNDRARPLQSPARARVPPGRPPRRRVRTPGSEDRERPGSLCATRRQRYVLPQSTIHTSSKPGWCSSIGLATIGCPSPLPRVCGYILDTPPTKLIGGELEKAR
jgi:hypothetical protein